MNPICANCAVMMICEKNDFVVGDQEVGNSPATHWHGDLYSCPKCKNKIVVGFSKGERARTGQVADLTFTRI